MQSNVNSFFESLAKGSHAQAAMSTDVDALSALATTQGFDVSPEDLRAALGEDLEIESCESKSLGWGVAYLSFKDH